MKTVKQKQVQEGIVHSISSFAPHKLLRNTQVYCWVQPINSSLVNDDIAWQGRGEEQLVVEGGAGCELLSLDFNWLIVESLAVLFRIPCLKSTERRIKSNNGVVDGPGSSVVNNDINLFWCHPPSQPFVGPARSVLDEFIWRVRQWIPPWGHHWMERLGRCWGLHQRQQQWQCRSCHHGGCDISQCRIGP